MKKLLALAALAMAVYWFGLRVRCGRGGALPCPAAELEAGWGETLEAREICPDAGYLCVGRSSFQVARWPLTKGKLRVRVSLPGFVDDKETARALRAATIEGILAWDGAPFPIVIDDAPFTLRIPDIEVVWTQGLFNAAAGLSTVSWKPRGDGLTFKSHGLAVVVPPIGGGDGPRSFTPGPALDAWIEAIAMHEMGHALGLAHSDARADIMFPYLQDGVSDPRLSARDLATIDAFYALPNGAMLRN